MRSRPGPMQNVTRMLRALRTHPDLVPQKGGISSGAVEGLHDKSSGDQTILSFRIYEAIKIALYHTLRRLPDPEATPNFAQQAFFLDTCHGLGLSSRQSGRQSFVLY